MDPHAVEMYEHRTCTKYENSLIDFDIQTIINTQIFCYNRLCAVRGARVQCTLYIIHHTLWYHNYNIVHTFNQLCCNMMKFIRPEFISFPNSYMKQFPFHIRSKFLSVVMILHMSRAYRRWTTIKSHTSSTIFGCVFNMHAER